MGILTAKKRKALPKSSFGEPGSRKYPMPDKAHAANAKSRDSEMENKGEMSESEKEHIFAKADKILGEHKSHYVRAHVEEHGID
jgi:hypothetical protein